MRLSRQRVFLLVLVSTLACHNAADLPALPAEFVLDNINGRPLPTVLSPLPGPTATVFSSSLALDRSGKAVMTEHRDTGQGDYWYTINWDYRINGKTIELGCFDPGPMPGPCLTTYSGTISAEALTLTIDPSLPVIYNYRIAPTL